MAENKRDNSSTADDCTRPRREIWYAAWSPRHNREYYWTVLESTTANGDKVTSYSKTQWELPTARGYYMTMPRSSLRDRSGEVSGKDLSCVCFEMESTSSCCNDNGIQMRGNGSLRKIKANDVGEVTMDDRRRHRAYRRRFLFGVLVFVSPFARRFIPAVMPSSLEQTHILVFDDRKGVYMNEQLGVGANARVSVEALRDDPLFGAAYDLSNQNINPSGNDQDIERVILPLKNMKEVKVEDVEVANFIINRENHHKIEMHEVKPYKNALKHHRMKDATTSENVRITSDFSEAKQRSTFDNKMKMNALDSECNCALHNDSERIIANVDHDEAVLNFDPEQPSTAQRVPESQPKKGFRGKCLIPFMYLLFEICRKASPFDEFETIMYESMGIQ